MLLKRIIFLTLVWHLAAVADDLPDLGDPSATVLSQQQERAIAEQILLSIADDPNVIQDVELSDYIQRLGNKMAAHADERQMITFFIVNDNTINAFALPGNIIGVHIGLMRATQHESELASVLAHEIAHETQHHLARILATQKTETIKSAIALAAAILLSRGNGQLSSGIATMASAASVQSQLNYTREHEQEADRIGLRILHDSGFDVKAMPAFFMTLQQGTRFSEGAAPSFLRTHPLSSERIADVENRVAQLPYKQIEDSLDFSYARAKAMVLGNQDISRALSVFQQNISEQRSFNLYADHYGLALSAFMTHQLTLADQEIIWLKQHSQPHPMIESLRAKVALAQKRVQEVDAIYTQALSLFPKNQALIYDYSSYLLMQKRPDAAVKLLREKLALYPRAVPIYRYLAQAYALQKQTLLMHQMQAEAYYNQHNLPQAVEQLELASRVNDGDFYQKSIVEARLKELRQLLSASKKPPL